MHPATVKSSSSSSKDTTHSALDQVALRITDGVLVQIHKVNEELDICEANVRGSCLRGNNCPLHHFPLPYLWQYQQGEGGEWCSLLQQSETVEKVFSDPATDVCTVQLANQGDGIHQASLTVYYEGMMGSVLHPNSTMGIPVCVRRLSTDSYGQSYSKLYEMQGGHQHNLYNTKWVWYYQDAHQWKQFGQIDKSPPQVVLEAKYCQGQEVYRFEVQEKACSTPEAYLVDFRLLRMVCLASQAQWRLKRRPCFLGSAEITAKQHIKPPPVKTVSLAAPIPENWSPLDYSNEYELVPLNPESLGYHLVASEFKNTLPTGREIMDVFRIQNPFLWSKYHCKKLQLQARDVPLNELQLFHGTSQETVVQAIFRQNFDWRMSGKNATVFGKGSYFAKDALYSDRYTGGKHFQGTRWMFLARVLVGRSTIGQKDFVRPPPVNPAQSFGELYDSCVDNVHKPRVYVIFDHDQCYPEYVISYKNVLRS